MSTLKFNNIEKYFFDHYNIQIIVYRDDVIVQTKAFSNGEGGPTEWLVDEENTISAYL